MRKRVLLLPELGRSFSPGWFLLVHITLLKISIKFTPSFHHMSSAAQAVLLKCVVQESH